MINDPATMFANMRRPQIDRTAIMNPQWARWLDQTAEAQGLDASQPYDLNLAGEFGRPSLDAMSYRRPKARKFNPTSVRADAPNTPYEF